MPTLLTRAGKGTELTHTELDANFKRTVLQKTTTYAVLGSDNNGVIEGNHASTPFTITLGDATTMLLEDTGSYVVTITNVGVAAVTVAPAGSDTINGITESYILHTHDTITVQVNSAGDGYNTLGKGVPAVDKIDTLVASASATIDFENAILFNGTYSKIYFVCESIIPGTDAVTFRAKIKTGGAYATANYGFHAQQNLATSTSYNASVATNAGAFNLHIGVGTGTGEGTSGDFEVYGPSNATIYKTCSWRFGGYNAQAIWEGGTGSGGHSSTAAIQGIRFEMNSGNIASGTITAYGVLN